MYIYRGVMHALPSKSNPSTTGIYRGFRWNSDNQDKNPVLTSGTYRGIKWKPPQGRGASGFPSSSQPPKNNS